MIGGGEVRTISGTYDWSKPVKNVVLPGSWHNSAVLLDDGRVLIASSGGGTINLYHSPSARDFIAGTWAFSNTLLTGSNYATGANVFRAPNGTIYMAVSDRYGQNVTQKIYVCADSSGLSWSLHGTVQSVLNDKFNNDSSVTGIPYFKSASEWVLSAPWFLPGNVFGGPGHRQAIWRSTDTGVTWTRVHEQQYYLLNGVYGEGQSPYVINSGGKYRWSSTGAGDNTWALSNDGASWTTGVVSGPASYLHHIVLADDLGYYVSNGADVWRFTGDYESGTETLVRATGYWWTNLTRFPTMVNISSSSDPLAWVMIAGPRMICPVSLGTWFTGHMGWMG